MKLNKTILKRLIKETMVENSMILTEALSNSYSGLMSNLDGSDPSITSVGIMSGQYPMAQSNLTPQEEAERAVQLNMKLDELGMNYVKIDGNYANTPEKSVVIENPTMQQMEMLCAEFEQESYVWGAREGDVLSYELRKVDHTAGTSSMYPGSKKTTVVMKHKDLKNASTNYSELNGMRFGFELF